MACAAAAKTRIEQASEHAGQIDPMLKYEPERLRRHSLDGVASAGYRSRYNTNCSAQDVKINRR